MEITARKISKRSVFKIYFLGLSGGFFFLFLFYGIRALFGAETVKWDGEPVTGVAGLAISVIMWPVMSFIFSAFMWLFSVVGLWMYSLINPITISFQGVVTGGKNETEQQ
ncbi:hypothetical protein AWR36_001385 [Microbulbifer flavimaris]|uniref:DUF3566 domain-containing protein n=1 Tax=Microbulbifer flavimaris TaxID=1781068 RepID=A0ABX4I3X1_9GAMM|nr:MULTISPECIES: hypothetical protein [Microbulbifer]KUJ84384.1 hypothetical protein AVO43_01390 [Microbulbifer sp. ZGT114]PCO06468.1 hypothetical protein AWR36_001385 [Microbulbifer flavimaris]